jgi:hypothetical protein
VNRQKRAAKAGKCSLPIVGLFAGKAMVPCIRLEYSGGRRPSKPASDFHHIQPFRRRSLRMTESAQTRTFRLAIRAPNNNGHQFTAIFPVSPSPIGYLGKEKLGTDFGKAKPAGVRQRNRGGETPRSTFAFGKAGSTAIAKTGRSIDRRSSESLAQKLQTNQDTLNHNEKAGECSFLFSR